MINYTASPLDSNKTLLQAFHDIETYLKNNPIYKVYTANIGYTPGTNTYMLRNINVGRNTIAENDVIFFNNAYVGIVSAIGSTEVTVKNITDLRGPDGQGVPKGGAAGQILAKKTNNDYDTEWTDAPSGGETGDNILQADVSFTSVTAILDYALNLEIGKLYKLNWTFNGVSYSQTTFCWKGSDNITKLGTMDTGGGGERILINPDNAGDGMMVVMDKMYANSATEESYPSENNATILVPQNYANLIIQSIEEVGTYTPPIPIPTIADNNKILQVQGGTQYTLVDLPDLYRHTIVINNAIDTALSFNLYNNSPDPINTVGKLIQAVGGQKGAIQINAISHENFPNYIAFYTELRVASRGDTIEVPGVRFNLSGTQPAQIKSVSDILATFTEGIVTDTIVKL